MKHKAGFVNIVGNPNVGKSTLMNQLVGERISIATFKAQTTRHRIMGIVNTDDMQIVFSDTPGVLKPNYKLQESMLAFSESALTDADVLVMGRLCDGVLLSVLRDVSRIPLVYEACERIRSVDIPLIGTVLNGVSFGKYRPYYSSYTIEVSTKSKSKAKKK